MHRAHRGGAALIEPLRECVHQPRRIEWPGGHADLTTNGNWVAYFDGRSGEVFRINACPGCLVPLWGLPAAATEPFHVPAEAHAKLPPGTPWPRGPM